MGVHQGILVAGRYRLLRESGRGGRGTVWRAHDDLLDREVAIKEVRLAPWMSDEERRSLCRRLIAEARATAALRHPGLVTVYDVVQQDERPWIVMELVDAPSLQEVIDGEGPLPPRRVAEIGRGILSALRAAHEAGILHRDVKPGNVLLPADGRILLTDFGLAIRAAEGMGGPPCEGSPAYVSPEQAWSRPVTEASDLWSLGATLYAAVEGSAPFGRPEPLASLVAVLVDDYAPPARAGPLRPVIDGLLRRDPAQRATATETGRRLARLIRRAERRSMSRRSVHWALTGAVMVGVAGLAAGAEGGQLNGSAGMPATTLTYQAEEAFHSDGMVPYVDPAGFTVHVPAGWRRSARAGGAAWQDPAGGGSLLICRAAGDPLSGLRGAERRALADGGYPGYRRLRLEPVAAAGHASTGHASTGHGATGRGAAEWEFTWRNLHAMHVRTGGFDLFFVTPDDRWTPGLRGYDAIQESFRPTGAPTGPTGAPAAVPQGGGGRGAVPGHAEDPSGAAACPV